MQLDLLLIIDSVKPDMRLISLQLVKVVNEMACLNVLLNILTAKVRTMSAIVCLFQQNLNKIDGM